MSQTWNQYADLNSFLNVASQLVKQEIVIETNATLGSTAAPGRAATETAESVISTKLAHLHMLEELIREQLPQVASLKRDRIEGVK